MSSVHIHGSYDPKSDWANNIYQNSMYFIFSLTPAKGVRYYDPEVEVKVTVEMINTTYKIKDKFRKGTSTPDKAIRRIRDWIASAKPLKESTMSSYFGQINERLSGMRHGKIEEAKSFDLTKTRRFMSGAGDKVVYKRDGTNHIWELRYKTAVASDSFRFIVSEFIDMPGYSHADQLDAKTISIVFSEEE